MKNDSDLTVETFAKRSSVFVLAFTSFIAIAPTLINGGGSAISFVWIPLCFITMPTVHYLCRELMRLRQRVSDLEKKQESQ